MHTLVSVFFFYARIRMSARARVRVCGIMTTLLWQNEGAVTFCDSPAGEKCRCPHLGGDSYQPLRTPSLAPQHTPLLTWGLYLIS